MKVRSAAGFSAAVGSQLLASVAPISLTIIVSTTQGTAVVGMLAVCMAVQLWVLGVLRGLTTDPYQYGIKSYMADHRRQALTGSTSAALLSCAAVGLVCVGVGMVIGGTWLGALAAIGATIVAVGMQDHLRVAMIVESRQLLSLVLDAGSVCTLLLAEMYASSSGQLWGYIACWSASASLYAIGALIALRVPIRIAEARRWLVLHRRDGLVFSSDYAVTAGLAQGAILLVSALAGLSAAGALRAAQVLLFPVSMVTRGAVAAVAPMIVGSVAAGDPGRAKRIGAGYSLFAAVGASLCSGWVFVPLSWLESLLGDSAAPARGVVIPAAVALGLMGVAMGPGLVLRALGKVGVATVLKVICAPVSVVSVLIGSSTHGAAGSQVGLAVGEGARALLAWRVLQRWSPRELEADLLSLKGR